MKINKVAAQCKSRGCAYIYDAPDSTGTINQWISNGFAAWLVTGLPYLVPDNIRTLFNLSQTQADEMRIESSGPPVGISFSDFTDYEVRAEERDILIGINKRALLPLWDGRETLLIDGTALEPLSAKREELSFYKRGSDTPYIAVKAGLLLVGIAMPHNLSRRERDMLGHVARTLPESGGSGTVTVVGKGFRGGNSGAEQKHRDMDRL